MQINPEMVHILELADKGYKTITIIKLKDIKENTLVMNGKKRKYKQVTRNYKKERNRNYRTEKYISEILRITGWT